MKALKWFPPPPVRDSILPPAHKPDEGPSPSAANPMNSPARNGVHGRMHPKAGRMEFLRPRFADEALEHGFRQDSLRWTRRFLRLLCGLGIIGAALTLHGACLSGIAAASPEAFAIGGVIRVSFALICLLLLIGIRRLSAPSVSGLTSAVYALACLTLALRMSEAAPADASLFQHTFFISRDGLTAFFSVTLAVLMLVPGGIHWNFLIAAVSLGFYLYLFAAQGDAQELRVVYASLVSGGVIGGMSYAVQRLRRQYFLAHVRLNETNQLLARLASTDELTDAVNRRRFFELAHQEMERSIRYDHPMTILIFDIDHFKSVNDRFGHPAGDEVLRRIAETVREHIRSSDVFARLGGEEFALLLPETDGDHALVMAERLRQAIADLKVEDDGRSIGASASFGLAERRSADREPENMLVRADRALYAAKNRGRNQVVTAE